MLFALILHYFTIFRWFQNFPQIYFSLHCCLTLQKNFVLVKFKDVGKKIAIRIQRDKHLATVNLPGYLSSRSPTENIHQKYGFYLVGIVTHGVRDLPRIILSSSESWWLPSSAYRLLSQEQGWLLIHWVQHGPNLRWDLRAFLVNCYIRHDPRLRAAWTLFASTLNFVSLKA
jgi:hypothetical protein